MVECCNAAGGRVVITANGVRWSARSTVTIQPIPYERTAASNQDGSLYTTYKTVPSEADITLSDRCGMKLEDIMSCPLDVSIDLIDVRRRYMFTKAVVVGRPSLNTEDGAISNLKIVSQNVSYENY